MLAREVRGVVAGVLEDGAVGRLVGDLGASVQEAVRGWVLDLNLACDWGLLESLQM